MTPRSRSSPAAARGSAPRSRGGSRRTGTRSRSRAAGRGRSRRSRGRSAGSRSSPTPASRPTPTAPSRRRSRASAGSTRSSSTPGSAARGRCSTSTRQTFERRLRVERHRGVPRSPARRSRTCSSGAGRSSRVASVAGLRAAPASLAYCSSKAALAMLTQCIALDHGPDGVRANCVCPGWVRTPMADGEMDALAGRLGVDARTPTRRRRRTCRCAGRARRRRSQARSPGCLSDDASYVNGAVIPVDGGQHDRSTSARSPSGGWRDERRSVDVAGVEVSPDHFIGGERVASDAHVHRHLADRRAAARRDRARRRSARPTSPSRPRPRRSRPGRRSAPPAGPSTCTGSPT